jgi:ABC-2 type transport system permease protein
MSLRPYLAGFRLALSQELIHRGNFFVGKAREFLFFGALLLVFQKLPHGLGHWSQAQLFTYTIISALVSSQIVTQGTNTIANEIADGDLTNFLLRPMSYLGYCLSRILAARALSVFGGLISITILLLIFPNIHLTIAASSPFSVLDARHSILFASLLFLGSLALMQLIDFIAGLLSFWTDRAYGPRFLTLILVQFCSGAYLPIDTLPPTVQKVLHATPFPSLIYAPVATLIDGVSIQTTQALKTQLVWMCILGIILAIIWRQGVRSYAAYGK